MKYTVDTEKKEVSILNCTGSEIVELAKQYPDFDFVMGTFIQSSPVYIPYSSPDRYWQTPYVITCKNGTAASPFEIGLTTTTGVASGAITSYFGIGGGK